MLTYYYIYDIVEPMSIEAITLKAYSKGFLKGHNNERTIRNTRLSFMKRTIGLSATKKEMTPSAIKKKPKMMHAW
ncbi:hypothetical protein HPAKL86_00375 [Helicobacter pylori Aklavik86]|uniref:Uncharacterized protein n=1 Tax=Helicobacter pylori Aklavik86 TaxID=1055532 RepID=K7YZG8_HELPX|nr:hypothetical protein HPAKL86_00375 [Helicobacter pylori Aklavik86]